MSLGDGDRALILNNRVVAVHGVDLPVGALVSLAVSPSRITFAGVGPQGAKVATSIARDDLIDLRIELRDDELVDRSPLDQFTVLGAGVGKALAAVVRLLAGHVEVSETVITIATETATVVMVTDTVTPEEADAMMVSVERDVSANRKRIIEAAPEEPEDEDLIELLGDLLALRDKGALTEAEFAAKKAEILSRI